MTTPNVPETIVKFAFITNLIGPIYVLGFQRSDRGGTEDFKAIFRQTDKVRAITTQEGK